MLTYRQLQNRTDAPPGSSWGLFGPDDEMGTVSLLTPERVLAGASCVRRGLVFGLDVAVNHPAFPVSANRGALRHHIGGMLPDHRDDYLDGFYPQTASQLDGLRHFRHPVHGFYNGVEDRLVAAGSPHLGINRWAEAGIVGRGVVVDVAAHLHQQGAAPAHEDGAPIPISAVADAARAQGVTFAPGDILLLRTGWLGFYLGLNDAGQARIRELGTSSGLVQSHETLEWLWDRRIALLAADNVAVEVLPAVPDSPFVTAEEAAGGPRSRHTGLMHRAMIPLLGMALGELWDLDALAKDCAATGTWDCLVVAKPLHLIGGVGSPANAVAIK